MYNSELTVCRDSPRIVYWYLELFLSMCITLHFATWNFIDHIVAHVSTLLMHSCSSALSWSYTIRSPVFVSLANLSSNEIKVAAKSISLMKITNKREPSTVTWGTPHKSVQPSTVVCYIYYIIFIMPTDFEHPILSIILSQSSHFEVDLLWKMFLPLGRKENIIYSKLGTIPLNGVS